MYVDEVMRQIEKLKKYARDPEHADRQRDDGALDFMLENTNWEAVEAALELAKSGRSFHIEQILNNYPGMVQAKNNYDAAMGRLSDALRDPTDAPPKTHS